jgi:hypothetical protein
MTFPRVSRLLASLLAASAVALATAPSAAEDAAPPIVGYDAAGAPANPKVEVAWNRYHDNAGLGEILRRLAEAHPDLATLSVVGRTYEGREIWCLEVTARSVGDPARKPAMYIDGNIHGNEAQAAEVVAYTAWLLCEQYGRVEKITNLLNERAFYLIPSINPDGRDYWLRTAQNPHFSRGGKVPVDDDGDGLFDEDGAEDIDGDGNLLQMRKRDPLGRMKPHPKFPDVMIPADRDEPGEFTMLGWEGIDNDGDGELNEDGPGGYDPNRNWPWDWQPESIQGGAHDYPFSLPVTRAVADYVKSKPNIAAAQSYHNAAGMILRSPGRQGGDVDSADEAVAAYIGKRGEEMIPFYDSLIVWKDLYTVWGGEIDWFYGGLGVICYTNELWTDENLYRRADGGWGEEDSRGAGRARERAFVRDLLFDEAFVAWKPYNHPLYGDIEIGGMKKNFGRVPPSFMLEEECHRNAAFTLYHADQMPRLEWGSVEALPGPGGLRRVVVEVRNTRIIPSRLARDVKNKINRSDLLVLEPADAVVSGGLIVDRWTGEVAPAKHRPNRLEVDAVPGMGAIRAEFLVKPDVPFRVVYDSVKGGLLEWDTGGVDALLPYEGAAPFATPATFRRPKGTEIVEATTERRAESKKLAEEGVKLFRDGKREEAVDLLFQARLADPANGGAHRLHGEMATILLRSAQTERDPAERSRLLLFLVERSAPDDDAHREARQMLERARK